MGTPEVVAYLSQFSDPVVVPRDVGVWPAAQVRELARDATGLIACMADRVDGAFLDRCPSLRVVAATLKGYDNFDAAACARRGVWLTIVPDTIIPPTAELAVGLVIGIMRRAGDANRAVPSGGFAGWRPQFYGSSRRDGSQVACRPPALTSYISSRAGHCRVGGHDQVAVYGSAAPRDELAGCVSSYRAWHTHR